MGHHLWAVLELRLLKLRSDRPSMLRLLPHTAQCTSVPPGPTSRDTTSNTHGAVADAANTSNCGIFDPGSTAYADAAINTSNCGVFGPGSATDADADADATCTTRQFGWYFAMGRCLMPGSHSSMASSSSGTTRASRS